MSGKGKPEPGSRQADVPFGVTAEEAEIERARVLAEIATAKVTPGHRWCSTCGANKPAHVHEVRPGSFVGVR